MEYTLEFYSESVRVEIFSWPDGIQASFTRIAERMVEYGPNLGMPYTRPFGDGLFEIRAKGKEGIGRAFFVPARIDWTLFCNSGCLSHGIGLTGFKG